MTNRPFGALGNTALAIVLFAAVPLWFVLLQSSELGADKWQQLWTSRLPELLWNTLSLAILVSVVCFILGVSAAW